MYEATIELLQALTDHVKSELRIRRSNIADATLRATFAIHIADINDRMDAARHELKGGA